MNKEYLIEEKPFKAILFFTIPMIIGNLFQQFYTMADSVVVGQFVGENALGGCRCFLLFDQCVYFNCNWRAAWVHLSSQAAISVRRITEK